MGMKLTPKQFDREAGYRFSMAVMSKTARGAKCAACGREFVTDRTQKYCSHACYISARFGGIHGNETYPRAV